LFPKILQIAKDKMGNPLQKYTIDRYYYRHEEKGKG
jgi:hypothetical protein